MIPVLFVTLSQLSYFFCIHCKWFFAKNSCSYIWLINYHIWYIQLLRYCSVIATKVMGPYFFLINLFFCFQTRLLFFYRKTSYVLISYFLLITYLVKSFSLYISHKTTSWVTSSCLIVCWEKLDGIIHPSSSRTRIKHLNVTILYQQVTSCLAIFSDKKSSPVTVLIYF